MSDHFSGNGHCLCKAVDVTASSVETKIGACHCSMCRQWAGGPFIGLDCGTEITFTGPVATFASSEWAERGFCQNCGTHLFYKFKGDGRYIVPAGVFEQTPKLTFDHQIFIDEKPDYYNFSEDTDCMTGAEVMAAFMQNG